MSGLRDIWARWRNFPVAMTAALVALLLLAGFAVIVQSEANYRGQKIQETRVQAEILAASVVARARLRRRDRRARIGRRAPGQSPGADGGDLRSARRARRRLCARSGGRCPRASRRRRARTAMSSSPKCRSRDRASGSAPPIWPPTPSPSRRGSRAIC
ncbi:MAG: hypothetical protein WDN44_12370 [Sphingomonas sp.]